MKKLLDAKSACEFQSAHQHVQNLLHTRPDLQSYVQNYYNNPKKYAEFEIRKIEGNRLMNGSSNAESNHHSNVSHLGAGATWEIAEQITKLLERERYLSQKKANEDNEWHLSSRTFVSGMTFPNDIEEDKEARLYLSQWAYSKLWLVSKKKSVNFTVRRTNTGSFVHLIGNTSENDAFFIPNNGRCPCEKRVAYMHQCEHEYKADGKLLLSKYNPKNWMSSYQHTITSVLGNTTTNSWKTGDSFSHQQPSTNTKLEQPSII